MCNVSCSRTQGTDAGEAIKHLSHDMIFPTMWYVQPAVSDQPAHTRSLIRALASPLNILSVKLLTEHHLEFLSLKGGCTGLSESTVVKMPHCRKSHVAAHLTIFTFSSIWFDTMSPRWLIVHIKKSSAIISKQILYFFL